MRYLRKNTATIVTVGPFYDRTDGVTIETGLTITNERISATVDLNDGGSPTLVLDNITGATSGTANDLYYITSCDAGLMALELAAANVDYLGRFFLTITDAANHCPVFHEFTILPEQVFDSLILGTDLLDANASQLGGTTQAGRDIGTSVLLSNGTGTGQVSLSSGAVLLQATQTGVTIPTVTNLTNAPTNGDLTATMKTSVNAEVDAALNTAIPGSPTADSINERIVAIDGVMGVTPLDAAGTRAALGLATANLDTQLADIPTVSEMNARTLAAAGYATPTNITAAAGVTLATSQPGVTIPTVTTVTNSPSGMALEASLTQIKGATFDTATDSLEAIRNRGDAAWTSGSAQPIPYAPTSIAFTIGNDESPAGEDVADLAAHDDVYVQCGENASTGLTFDVLSTQSGKQTENPSLVRVSAFYNGSAGHELAIQVYNYVTAAYESVAVMKTRTTMFDYTVPLDSDNHDPANGSMKIRFLHNSTTYNASHYLRVDSVSFEKRTTTDALASDVAQILSQVNDIDLEMDELMDTRLTAARATNLDNLDLAISNKAHMSRYVGLGWVTGIDSSGTGFFEGAGVELFPQDCIARIYHDSYDGISTLLSEKAAGVTYFANTTEGENPSLLGPGALRYSYLRNGVTVDPGVGLPKAIQITLVSGQGGGTGIDTYFKGYLPVAGYPEEGAREALYYNDYSCYFDPDGTPFYIDGAPAVPVEYERNKFLSAVDISEQILTTDGLQALVQEAVDYSELAMTTALTTCQVFFRGVTDISVTCSPALLDDGSSIVIIAKGRYPGDPNVTLGALTFAGFVRDIDWVSQDISRHFILVGVNQPIVDCVVTITPDVGIPIDVTIRDGWWSPSSLVLRDGTPASDSGGGGSQFPDGIAKEATLGTPTSPGGTIVSDIAAGGSGGRQATVFTT